MRVAVPRRRGPAGLRNLFLLLSELWLVHTRLSEKNRTQRLTRRNRGCFGWGRYLYPLTVLRDPETLRGQVSERQTLPLLGLGRGCAPEERREPRDSDALKHFASLSHLGKRQPEEADARIRRASASSGTAAPLGCENHSLPQ